MVFSSLEFLLWFLPFFIAIYYLTPRKYRNLCLFVFSMVFYAYGALDRPVYILLLLESIGVNYLLARGMDLADGTKKPALYRKIVLIAGLLHDFGFLFLFKYHDFFAEIINGIASAFAGRPTEPVALAHLLLPIGISFYTFQAVSYLIDVYRRDIPAEKNILYLGTYISMFPQLIAGPIVRYSDVSAKMKRRSCNATGFLLGLETFVTGLGMKVLLANRLGGLWQNIGGIGYESISTPLAWMGIVAYSLQIYFDFYGYSLMAIGLGRMIGFRLPVNFRHPYVSCSMTEFWRRWHITLGSWFKEYVYIPLGGNRKGKNRTYLNLLAVWTLTGFWHGADWNFILWGLFLFAVIALEKAGLGRILSQHRGLGHLYMVFLIPLSWLIFAVSDLQQLAVYLGRLIGLGGVNVYAGDFIKYGTQYGIFLVLGLIFSTGIPEKFLAGHKRRYLRWAVLLAVFAGSLYCIYMGMNDPFLYFRF